MVAKYFQRSCLLTNSYNCNTIMYLVLGNTVGLVAYVISSMICNQFGQYRVGFIVNKNSSFLNLLNKNDELFQVKFKRGKDIDMIPGYPGKQGYMREKKMKFGFSFDRAGRIFISSTCMIMLVVVVLP